jgi:hypothetical protein
MGWTGVRPSLGGRIESAIISLLREHGDGANSPTRFRNYLGQDFRKDDKGLPPGQHGRDLVGILLQTGSAIVRMRKSCIKEEVGPVHYQEFLMLKQGIALGFLIVLPVGCDKKRDEDSHTESRNKEQQKGAAEPKPEKVVPPASETISELNVSDQKSLLVTLAKLHREAQAVERKRNEIRSKDRWAQHAKAIEGLKGKAIRWEYTIRSISESDITLERNSYPTFSNELEKDRYFREGHEEWIGYEYLVRSYFNFGDHLDITPRKRPNMELLAIPSSPERTKELQRAFQESRSELLRVTDRVDRNTLRKLERGSRVLIEGTIGEILITNRDEYILWPVHILDIVLANVKIVSFLDPK